MQRLQRLHRCMRAIQRLAQSLGSAREVQQGKQRW